MNRNGPENGWGKLSYFYLWYEGQADNLCFNTPFSCCQNLLYYYCWALVKPILLTHPYHKLLSLAPSELFCELCQSSGPDVRELSYPFLKLFLYIAECTSGKSVSSNLILPLLDFFHFLTVFTFLCGQSTCACGSICQDLLSGWLGQLHPDECAGSEGGQPRRVLQCRQHRARLLYRQRINYVKIQFTQDPWQILWKWSTVRNLTRHSVLQSALNPLYFTTQ